MFRSLANHKALCLILALFFLAQVISPGFKDDIWWDAAVYIGMGKTIYSVGEIGLWEPARPIVWPALLGFFWKVGLNPIVAGKLVSIIFSVGILIVLYQIALITFKNKHTATFSILFLATIAEFFSFSSKILTEIPSTFFILIGTLFLLKNKYKEAGFFVGLAVMTRFFQIFTVIAILIYLAIQFSRNKTKKANKNTASFLIFLGIPIMLFLGINTILYQNPVLPITKQMYLTLNTGEIYSQGLFFYFIQILKQNALLFLAIPGIFYSFKKNKHALILTLLFLASFIPYLLIDHKELRLIIPTLPFICLFAAHTIEQLLKNKQKFAKPIATTTILFSAAMLLVNIPFNSYEDGLDDFYKYTKNAEKNKIWISNPKFITNSDLKTDELIYYPRYNSNKITELNEKIHEAQAVLINTCDLFPCPAEDNLCRENHDNFVSHIKERFKTSLEKKQDNCIHYIFEK